MAIADSLASGGATLRWMAGGGGVRDGLPNAAADLSKTSHANCHTTLTNRPAGGRRGRFVRVVPQLACEVLARTAVWL